MVIVDQHRPLGARQLGDGRRDRAVRADRPPRAVAAEHIRAGVTRVGEHRQHPRVRQLTPSHLARPRAAIGALREPAALEDADDAIGGAGLLERSEQVGDRGLDLFVGVDDRQALVVVDVADRQREPQLAALRGRALGALQARGDHVQLRLGHLRLQPEQQPVVEVLQVIDPVSVDHEGVGQRAELKQPLRLGVRARQPRDLQPEDRADLAQAHPGDQLRVPLPRLRVREPAGDPQIPVHDHDPLRLPPQPGGLLGQRVLTLGRAEVLPDLPRRGLAQVHDRHPLPMRAGDLRGRAHHRRHPPPPRTRPCSRAPRPPRAACLPPITPAPAASTTPIDLRDLGKQRLVALRHRHAAPRTPPCTTAGT